MKQRRNEAAAVEVEVAATVAVAATIKMQIFKQNPHKYQEPTFRVKTAKVQTEYVENATVSVCVKINTQFSGRQQRKRSE